MSAREEFVATMSAPLFRVGEPAAFVLPALESLGLRPYQERAVQAIETDLRSYRSTLLVSATGTGKTQTAIAVCARTAGRVLWLAHRDELINQAAARFRQMLEVEPEIEKAQSFAQARGTRPVVASIQSLQRADRLREFQPDAFALVVADETHHGTSDSWRRVLDYFTGAKLLGLTATPDRLDGAALGEVFESVAFEYEITDAQRDGWLCPVMVRQVFVHSIDLSRVKTVAGDFAQGELDAIMATEENLHAIAKPTVELSGQRKTIVFTTSVENANRLAEILDRYEKQNVAFTVNAKTDIDERRRLIEQFRSTDRWKYFVNVGIASEGADFPDVSCIVQGRPTKSRALYVQQLGRGLRICEGKTDCLLLDFVGNTGKHDVVSAIDALAGHLSESLTQRAEKLLSKADAPMTVEEAVRQARAQEEKEIEARKELAQRNRRQGILAEVEYEVVQDPYKFFRVERDYLHERYGIDRASETDRAELLRRFGEKSQAAALPDKLSHHEARRMLTVLRQRQRQGLSTYKQVRFLAKKGQLAGDWTFDQASEVISWIADHGWQTPPADVVDRILYGREPGEEG